MLLTTGEVCLVQMAEEHFAYLVLKSESFVLTSESLCLCALRKVRQGVSQQRGMIDDAAASNPKTFFVIDMIPFHILLGFIRRQVYSLRARNLSQEDRRKLHEQRLG